MKNYTVNEDSKLIELFDEHFYQIKENGKEYNLFSVTGWLNAFPKGYGYKLWLMNTKNPDEIRDEAGQLGSESHRLIEQTFSGETIKWKDVEDIDVWERYIGWCNFWNDLQTDPQKTLGLNGIERIEIPKDFTEFIIYDLDIMTAGTVDKMVKIVFKDGSSIFVILDWKTGKNIYATAHIQVATYAKMVMKKYKLTDIKAYIVQINPSLNKNGYRVYETENIDEEYQMFLATQKLYLRAFGEPKPKYLTYPTEVDLTSIKKVPLK